MNCLKPSFDNVLQNIQKKKSQIPKHNFYGKVYFTEHISKKHWTKIQSSRLILNWTDIQLLVVHVTWIWSINIDNTKKVPPVKKQILFILQASLNLWSCFFQNMAIF